MNNETPSSESSRTAAAMVSKAVAKHTPGPWVISQVDPSLIRWHEIPIAELCCDSAAAKEWKANACLIAAAPELLEILTKLCAVTDCYCGRIITCYRCQAISVIAKAEGRE